MRLAISATLYSTLLPRAFSATLRPFALRAPGDAVEMPRHPHKPAVADPARAEADQQTCHVRHPRPWVFGFDDAPFAI